MKWDEICTRLGSESKDALDAHELQRIVKRHWREAIDYWGNYFAPP